MGRLRNVKKVCVMMEDMDPVVVKKKKDKKISDIKKKQEQYNQMLKSFLTPGTDVDVDGHVCDNGGVLQSMVVDHTNNSLHLYRRK